MAYRPDVWHVVFECVNQCPAGRYLGSSSQESIYRITMVSSVVSAVGTTLDRNICLSGEESIFYVLRNCSKGPRSSLPDPIPTIRDPPRKAVFNTTCLPSKCTSLDHLCFCEKGTSGYCVPFLLDRLDADFLAYIKDLSNEFPERWKLALLFHSLETHFLCCSWPSFWQGNFEGVLHFTNYDIKGFPNGLDHVGKKRTVPDICN